MVEELRKDIRNFKEKNGCSRIVVLWAASTEIYVPVCEEVHGTLAALEQAMKNDDREHVAPSMCYAYAALAEGAPFIMGAPNTTVDIPAMWEMAEKTKMPIAGKDFKTGQTLVKSGFAPIIGTRCLGLSGWFSTNILGNRDGLVLDEPANFHTKEVSKLSTLESILVPEEQPDLYTDYYHKVRINYYPPRNDNKEGWDNIDIFGWMGYPMQIKINFLCRDSILAAPLCLDLVLLSDLAARAGRYGIQRFLSFFLKSPMHDYTADEVPVNHLFQQYVMLKNALREMGGYEADEKFVFFNVLYIPVSFLLFVYFFGIWGKKSVSQNIEATKSAFYAPSKLLTEGIYARVQHPMIIGDILGHFSLVLLTGGIYTCILFPIYVFIDLFMIKIQVKYSLEPYYKSELIVYRKKTPILLDQKLLFIVLFMALLVICNFLNYTKII